MEAIKQRTQGPGIEQTSNYFEFNFADINDAEGTDMDFSSWSAKVEILPLYSNTPVFTILDADITMSADDISVSYDTSAISAYVKGEYRYRVLLTEPSGKEYERIYGFLRKK